METSVALDYVRGKISVSDYWSATFPRFLFDDYCCACSAWAEQLRSVVNSSFWTMHALDRTDPFWKNTNGLATESKLHEFAAYQARKDPNSLDAAWLTIAVNLFHGSDHLDAPAWRVLFQARVVDARFLACSASSMSAYWGDANIYRFANLVRELDLGETIEPALQWLSSQGEEHAEWVCKARSALTA